MRAKSAIEIYELQIRRQLPFKYNIGQPKFVEDDSEIVMHLLARSTTENESAPDAAGKLAPQEGSESMPEKADESAPDEASESMADDTGESETDSLWVGII